MEHKELEKSKAFIAVEILGYVPNSVLVKTIVQKPTGNITAVSFDSGAAIPDKSSPFDTFVQIIEGTGEIIIGESANSLKTGQSIIIPAHERTTIKALERFKMIATVIKSGYEELA